MHSWSDKDLIRQVWCELFFAAGMHLAGVQLPLKPDQKPLNLLFLGSVETIRWLISSLHKTGGSAKNNSQRGSS